MRWRVRGTGVSAARTCSAKRYRMTSPSGPCCLSCWMYLQGPWGAGGRQLHNLTGQCTSSTGPGGQGSGGCVQLDAAQPAGWKPQKLETNGWHLLKGVHWTEPRLQISAAHSQGRDVGAGAGRAVLPARAERLEQCRRGLAKRRVRLVRGHTQLRQLGEKLPCSQARAKGTVEALHPTHP